MRSDAQQAVEGSASARVENGGDIVVNVQGDETFLIPGHIDEVIRSLERQRGRHWNSCIRRAGFT